ncbi:MAG TPA: acyl carrier protein phosphodiesterase [Bacteroidia bacterium]|jgi:acyl carrier protein phosphodiesterase|nr:acyl carrier protein phosphodiesterase [Bacteroidia bacterium]
MNYLAHAFLSFNNEQITVGNFIADHIKLADAEKLPPEIKKGVLLHRRIDYFTDTHPLFIKSKRYFYNGFERYSGVLVDIYYDHILAKNFNKFSDIGLEIFTKNIYALLQKNKAYLPESSIGFLNYIIQRNTFFEYSKIEGIELVLKHLSYRINHGVFLNESIPLFLKNEKAMEQEFFEFMDDLIRDVKAFK